MFSSTLRLCPAGGPSFFEAFQLVCPMKRRKRSIRKEHHRASSRKMSVSPSEELPLLMEKCCKKGCDFEALHKMCDPFDF
ncbi:unnamed protein product, partial [Mesorhabditis belari]|uniref:Insulin-like domain-containing protein n=1 Tax=Mesorhabditis belari TaxID=2138241 RepID=A0AAF3E835_9BILA